MATSPTSPMDKELDALAAAMDRLVITDFKCQDLPIEISQLRWIINLQASNEQQQLHYIELLHLANEARQELESWVTAVTIAREQLRLPLRVAVRAAEESPQSLAAAIRRFRSAFDEVNLAKSTVEQITASLIAFKNELPPVILQSESEPVQTALEQLRRVLP